MTIRTTVLAHTDHRREALIQFLPAGIVVWLAEVGGTLLVTILMRVLLTLSGASLAAVAAGYKGIAEEIGGADVKDLESFLRMVNAIPKAYLRQGIKANKAIASKMSQSLMAYFGHGGVIKDAAMIASASLLCAAITRIIPVIRNVELGTIKEQLNRAAQASKKVYSAVEVAGTAAELAGWARKYRDIIEEEDWSETRERTYVDARTSHP